MYISAIYTHVVGNIPELFILRRSPPHLALATPWPKPLASSIVLLSLNSWLLTLRHSTRPQVSSNGRRRPRRAAVRENYCAGRQITFFLARKMMTFSVRIPHARAPSWHRIFDKWVFFFCSSYTTTQLYYYTYCCPTLWYYIAILLYLLLSWPLYMIATWYPV